MSASMAAVLARLIAETLAADDTDMGPYVDADYLEEVVIDGRFNLVKLAEVLAANGYGKLEPTQFVLAEREAELLNLKGPCRAPQCRLHHAHRGPCDTRRPE